MKSEKEEILLNVISQLENLLDTLIKSALDAKDAATNEESKAENKYDTRGLEASYLAGAQAKRATDLSDSIKLLKELPIKAFDETTPIQNSALIEVEMNGQNKKWFFMLPKQGGMKVERKNRVVVTITPDSPLGELLMNKKVDDYFELSLGGNMNEYDIISVQ